VLGVAVGPCFGQTVKEAAYIQARLYVQLPTEIWIPTIGMISLNSRELPQFRSTRTASRMKRRGTVHLMICPPEEMYKSDIPYSNSTSCDVHDAVIVNWIVKGRNTSSGEASSRVLGRSSASALISSTPTGRKSTCCSC